jgi:hypothetical protein
MHLTFKVKFSTVSDGNTIERRIDT